MPSSNFVFLLCVGLRFGSILLRVPLRDQMGANRLLVLPPLGIMYLVIKANLICLTLLHPLGIMYLVIKFWCYILLVRAAPVKFCCASTGRWWALFLRRNRFPVSGVLLHLCAYCLLSDMLCYFLLGRYQSHHQNHSISCCALSHLPCTQVGKVNTNTNQLWGGTRSAENLKKVTRRKQTSVE